MAIIWTYPRLLTTAETDDLLLITDISDNKKTKSIEVNLLPFTNNLGTVTSVALSMPAAFAVANSPITTSGTLSVTTTGGSAGQYLDYTGNWSTPPSGGNLPIEDEGSQITSAAAKINFTGAGVTASASGNDVTVNIPGGGGSGSPGGSDTQMQYNDGGSFGGTTGLTWDDSTNILSIATRYEGDIDGAVLQQVLVKEPGGVSKGDVVYISGGTGDNPEVRKAQSNSVSTMAALGIMKNNTSVDAIGECVTSGEITGVDLTGFTTGDELFVSNTTAGGLLTSAPTGEANLIQKIGKVIKGGAGGALTVLGAFRTNATPNLNQGSLFIGNGSNQASTLAIGTNTHVLTSNGTTASWQAIPASGVTSFTNANGTYISAGTENTSATGAVTVGTIDLSAVDGTAIASTRFLSKDNTWDVPAYTTYSAASSSSLGLMKLASDTEQSVAANAVTSESGRTYGIQFNADDQAVVNVPWTDTTTSPAGSNTQIQYNNSGSFGATDLFTYSSRILSVGKVGDSSRSHLKVFGGGTEDSYLTLYCSAGTHGVTIEGPDHTGGSNYTLKLPASLPSVANQVLESNASGTLSWIPTPSGGSSKLGFTPLSIYEATGKIESVAGEEGSAFSIIRQSVCETDCTIDKVDFFRLAGTDRVTIAVYTGTIASGAGNLRLSGGQSSGTANQINTITFSTPYTFSAGDDIVILISLQYATGNDAELLGATNLHPNSALGRENTTYYSSPASDFSTIVEDFSTVSAKAGALHFYDE